jgi:uncharacterized membrane protein YhaH (DUF805 family)
MDEVLTGIARVAFGGFILLSFGLIAVRSLWNKAVRDELLSDPHLRNPSMFHRIMFALIGLTLLAAAAALTISGLARLGLVSI